MTLFPVAEIFTSVNGEGTRAGQLAVFVRFCGCNLRCSFCDTAWANEKNAPRSLMSAQEILRRVKDENIRNVTVTGGEPLIQDGIGELLRLLSQDGGLSAEVETNGSVSLAPYMKIPRLLFTMDYKLPGSGMHTRMEKANFSILRARDTVKFVAGDQADLDYALDVIKTERLLERCNVYFSPVFGKLEASKIVDFMKEHKLNGAVAQPQMHKYIWNPDARGV